MGNIFITSDTHFCHQKEFLWAPRGFSSVEEMNETIVERWNSAVTEYDTVYHLGDIALSDTTKAISYLQRLNGQIKWLRGNHDSDNRIKEVLEACPQINMLCYMNWDASWATVLKDGKWRFYLSHYPTKVGNYDEKGSHKTWCLCGHVHTQDKWLDVKDNCYHIEMDAHDCYPVALEDIKADIRQYVNACENKPF